MYQENQLIWYGHIQRMGDEGLQKKVMKWIQQENRKKGRPRRSMSEIKRTATTEINGVQVSDNVVTEDILRSNIFVIYIRVY